MNVLLIPFFLAANVVVNDVSEWRFGPEYLFNLSIAYDVREESTSKHFVTGNTNFTINCRPKQSNTMFCDLSELASQLSQDSINHSGSHNRKSMEAQRFEKRFMMKFNEHGLETLLIEPPSDVAVSFIVRKIADQFNMDVNEMRGSDVSQQIISQYTKNENTSRGKCMTQYVIKRNELEANKIKRNNNFQLEVLPIAGIATPGMNLSINKIRTECANTPKFPEHVDGYFEMKRFTSVATIDNGYKVLTVMNGYVKPSETSSNRTILYEEKMDFHLDSIKPAKGDRFSTFNGQAIDLNMNSDVPRTS